MSAKQLFLSSLVVCLFAGLSTAASCQERKAPAKAAPKGEGQVKKTAIERQVGEVFPSQVAGVLYADDADQLRRAIRGFLDQAGRPKQPIQGDLLGVVVPHAGFAYSGPVAAHAFALLQGRRFSRVVLLGPAHLEGYSPPALLDADAYRTPLGDIPIDREGVRALAKTGAAQIDKRRFVREHALEVELPFLQVALGDFSLVPVMISRLAPDGARRLARVLRETFPAGDTLYVASTDLSHDFPYDVAVAMDNNAVRLIKSLDTEALYRAWQAHRRVHFGVELGPDGKLKPDCTQLCGLGPVLALLELARVHGGAEATLLDQRNSGDIVGDRNSRIVGYAAMAVSLTKPRRAAGEGQAGTGDEFLGQGERRELLQLARKTLERYLEQGEKPGFEPKHPKLNQPGAAFVTLKKHGQLRGCIGHMEPTDPLWKMVRDRAVDAATRDSRFERVSPAELKDIQVEISVLTPRVRVKDPLQEIRIGRDGVWLERGAQRGVFLPQVPVEQGWKTVEEYLDHLCRKAHIQEQGCWKSSDAVIQRFTALVFAEGE